MLLIIIAARSMGARYKDETKVRCNDVSLSNLLFRQKLEDSLKSSEDPSAYIETLRQRPSKPYRIWSQKAP